MSLRAASLYDVLPKSAGHRVANTNSSRVALIYWRCSGDELGAIHSLEVWWKQGPVGLFDMQVGLPIIQCATLGQ